MSRIVKATKRTRIGAQKKTTLPASSTTSEQTRSLRSQSSKQAITVPQQSSSDSSASGIINIRSSRVNENFIFFWGGPLSNWNLGTKFPGSRCLELLLPRLEEIKIKHPASDAFSTLLLRSHDFVCGEQWMMALKGWLFERDISLSERSEGTFRHGEFQTLRDQMLSSNPCFDKDDNENVINVKWAMYNSTLCRCLRSEIPREHKYFGRQARLFQSDVWDKASMDIVVSASVARAEKDDELANVYRNSGTRRFVEGSPLDKIWGVGLRYDAKPIEDPRNWKGENRLGTCHDRARKIFFEGHEKENRGG